MYILYHGIYTIAMKYEIYINATEGEGKRNEWILTTTKFHIFAASATVVHTVLHPANSINL